jgi:hypothetical protein
MEQAQAKKKEWTKAWRGLALFPWILAAYVCGGVQMTVTYGPKIDIMQNKILHLDSTVVENHKQALIRNATIFYKLDHIDSAVCCHIKNP